VFSLAKIDMAHRHFRYTIPWSLPHHDEGRLELKGPDEGSEDPKKSLSPVDDGGEENLSINVFPVGLQQEVGGGARGMNGPKSPADL